MTQQRALVKNAGDRKQVQSAAKREKLRREKELDDIRIVMSTPAGRRYVWRLLSSLNVFGSVMRDGVERVMFLAGKQDAGHFVQAEVLAADEKGYLLMQQEAFALSRSEQDIADVQRAGAGKAETETEHVNPDEDAQ